MGTTQSAATAGGAEIDVPTGLPLHFGLLNVWLLDSHQDHASELARNLESHIVRAGRIRTRHARMRYLSKAWKVDGEPVDFREKFFQPRVYATWGSFDVAACFLSPDWNLLPQSMEMTEAGQIIQISLIPKKPLDAEGDDFNQQFITDYQTRPRGAAPASRGGRLADDLRFVGIFKLKTSAAATWPEEGEDPDRAAQRVRDVFSDVWKEVASWRNSVRVVGGGPPVVCIGLGLGWNEYVVVAHTDSPGKLLRLYLSLRRLWLKTIPRRDGKQSHAFAATLPTTGADYRLRDEAAERLQEVACVPHERLLPASKLLELAMELAGHERPPSEGDLQRCHVRTAFVVYPGHEVRVCRLLAEAEESLRRANPRLLAQDGPRGSRSVAVEVGRQDVLGPVLAIDEHGFTPTQAAAYVAVLLPWIRRNADCRVDPDATILNYFNSFTRIGCEPEECDAAFPPNHTSRLPRDARRSETLDRATGRPGTASSGVPDPIGGLSDAIRKLQLPYMLTEQILNLVTAFRWAHHHEILWEENLEFAPLYMCLMGRVRSAADGWARACDDARPMLDVADERRAAWARSEMQRLHRELPLLLRAFRNVFHSRLLTGYVADDLADVNLRYRGSVHQFLSVANMILDSLALHLLGPRACVATLGDTPSPKVSSPCDLIEVELSAHTLQTPVFLDSIGHELGHLLLKELDQLDAPELSANHAWSGRRWLLDDERRELRDSFRELDRRVFLGELRPALLGSTPLHEEFVESTSDLIERHLLAFESFEEWTRSIMLRATLAALPVDRDPPGRRATHADVVPRADTELLMTIVLRTALVAVADELATWDGKSLPQLREDLLGYRLARLRETLRDTCVVGPSTDVLDLLTDEWLWRDFMTTRVLAAPWLARPRAAQAAQAAFRALIDHVRRPGGDPLLPRVVGAMRDLRALVLPNTTPSVHLRFWAGFPERDMDENWSANGSFLVRDSQDGTPPWRAVPQPIRHVRTLEEASGDESSPAYRAVVGQRGFVFPISDAAMRAVVGADCAFYARLMPYLPGWRDSLLSRIDRVERAEAAPVAVR